MRALCHRFNSLQTSQVAILAHTSVKMRPFNMWAHRYCLRTVFALFVANLAHAHFKVGLINVLAFSDCFLRVCFIRVTIVAQALCEMYLFNMRAPCVFLIFVVIPCITLLTHSFFEVRLV